jgi:hypothetical protein
MKKNTLLALGLAAAFAAAPASGATLNVGHGIPGENGLPVDICLVTDGVASALFTDVTFGTFAEVPIDLDAGRYDVEVRLSDGQCTGTVAVAGSIFLGLGENATAFAHLTEQGTPTITKYVNDFRPLMDGKTRIYARHAAAAGDVNVILKKHQRRHYRDKVIIRGLENPDQEGADLRAGDWFVAIYPAKAWRHPLFSAKLSLDAGIGYFAYAVGSPGDGSFTVLLQPLPIPTP